MLFFSPNLGNGGLDFLFIDGNQLLVGIDDLLITLNLGDNPVPKLR